MKRRTLNSRVWPSCLATWRKGPECKCGYALTCRRMPTIRELMADPPGQSWDAVDLPAWTRMVWALARATP